MKKSLNFIIFLLVIFLIHTIAGATSQKFNASIVISSPTTTTTTATQSTGGGGGGEMPITKDLVLVTKNLDISIKTNTITTRQVELYNKGDNVIRIGMTLSQGLENTLYIKEDIFELAPKEKKKINIEVMSPSIAGIYTGKIIVNGQPILTVINVNTEELLFNIDAIIPETIDPGEILKSQIFLSQIGEKKQLNLTINYVVKDFEGNTLLTDSEVILFKDQISLAREFITEKLPYGEYILGIELIHANNIATSSVHFKIKEKKFPFINYILISTFLGIIILIIVLMAIRKRHKKIRQRIKKKIGEDLSKT